MGRASNPRVCRLNCSTWLQQQAAPKNQVKEGKLSVQSTPGLGTRAASYVIGGMCVRKGLFVLGHRCS